MRVREYKKFMITILLMLCLVTCGTVDTAQDRVSNCLSDSIARITVADRCEIKGLNIAYLVCLGTASERKSKDEAIRSAKINTLTEIAESFGVLVDHEFEESEREVNGQIEYRIKTESHATGKPIWLKNYRIEKSLVDEQENGNYSSSVRISIPKSEYDRIQKELEAKALWALELNGFSESEQKDIENEIIKSELFTTLQKNGINIEISHKVDHNLKSAEIAKKYNKYAYFLKIIYDRVYDVFQSKALNRKLYKNSLKIDIIDLQEDSKRNHWEAEQYSVEKNLITEVLIEEIVKKIK
ncbi:hypothetical protein J6Z39_00020 [bacterium]|nr:hypothetical protein [bacterium]MBP5434190.1 hypothetical protein [bacterium]